MKTVITYGTFDLLHFGHIRLLERAKSLGDYLIVGVTADDFDKVRGKINVQQSLMERIEAVKATGLADKIIIEEYEGQKIDDIRRYNVDVFTVGTDWEGTFDYLREFCEVVYLERTDGVSSSQIRVEKSKVKLGIVGESVVAKKYIRESSFVNGVEVVGAYTQDKELASGLNCTVKSYQELLDKCDAVFIISLPELHYEQIKLALEQGKHVLCEPPITISEEQNEELQQLALNNNCVLMDALKTAYATAYARLVLLAKSGRIGQIYSVDATCTSLRPLTDKSWNSICSWGPTAMLPVFNILGTDYKSKKIISSIDENGNDTFTKIEFLYDHAVASVKIGKGVKSEGELVISGTKGYIYVPAPWWKTDYFEIRFEDSNENKRYFYHLDGEGIRFVLVELIKAIDNGGNKPYVETKISNAISGLIEDFYKRKDFFSI